MIIPLAMVCAGLGAWTIVVYNLLVRDRARVAAAWSDVSIQLVRRHDLIPKLVEVARQHAGFERGVLERVAHARSQAQNVSGPADSRAPETSIGLGLQKLIAVAEAYPALKASQSFLDLQHQLSEVEDQIQYARRYYNGAVNNLNTRLDTFPDLIIARLFGYRPAEYFELDSAEQAQPAGLG